MSGPQQSGALKCRSPAMTASEDFTFDPDKDLVLNLNYKAAVFSNSSLVDTGYRQAFFLLP
jgi:hypothetical protein